MMAWNLKHLESLPRPAAFGIGLAWLRADTIAWRAGGLPTVYASVTDEILVIRSRSSHALQISFTVGSPHRAHALRAAGGYFAWSSGRIWS